MNAKPIPPGAGDGDVAANILFLVDSSASMGSWIGKDGIGQSFGVSYDAEGRILVGQNVRDDGDELKAFEEGGEPEESSEEESAVLPIPTAEAEYLRAIRWGRFGNFSIKLFKICST